MSSHPSSLPPDLTSRPSSPALASPRPSSPAFNPFNPSLPTASQIVRLSRRGTSTPAAGEARAEEGEEMPKIRSHHVPFGEIGKEAEEWAAVDEAARAERERQEFGAPFLVGTRRRGAMPMVRISRRGVQQQSRRKEDAATTALGKELGALDLGKKELGELEAEVKVDEEASPKEAAPAESDLTAAEAQGDNGAPSEAVLDSPQPSPGQGLVGEEQRMAVE